MSIVWLVEIALLIIETDFVTGTTIGQRNCDAAREEYETTKKHCKDIFRVCSIRQPGCDATRFCSDECREIYHLVKGRNCSNSSSAEKDLEDLNLLCSPSGHNKTCASLIGSGTQTSWDYSYRISCAIEIQFLVQQSPAASCFPGCNSSLVSYKGECCAINIALLAIGFMENETIHADSLWKLCGISSPGKCPSPPPPTPTPPIPTSSKSLTPSTNPTVSASPAVSPSPGGDVHAEADHLLLLTTVTLSSIYYALY